MRLPRNSRYRVIEKLRQCNSSIIFAGAVWPRRVTKIMMIARVNLMSGSDDHQSRHDKSGVESASLLVLAKGGDGAALGRLLERYRNYMGLLVRLHVGRRLRSKVDVDDLLQEIWLEIHRKIAQFRGQSEREFLTWVRRLIGSILANQLRHYIGTRARDLRLERALTAELDASSRVLDRSLIAPESSPSQQAVRREQAVLLADALQNLPEDYREVIILRQLEGLSFPDVARRLGRTEDSVKNVWLRALARLRRTLEDLR
jgi:RNA polymerase sigma-70 factor, ECF subfamily